MVTMPPLACGPFSSWYLHSRTGSSAVLQRDSVPLTCGPHSSGGQMSVGESPCSTAEETHPSTPSPPGHRHTAFISADVWSRPLRLRRLGSPGAPHRQQGRHLHPRRTAHRRGLQYVGAEHRIGTSAPRTCRASDRTPTTAMPSSPPPGGPRPPPYL